MIAHDAILLSGFIPIGLHPGGGHTALLGRTGNREAAAALTLFGERVDGRRAAELGLAWTSTETDAVLDTAGSRSPPSPPPIPSSPAARRRLLRMNIGPPALPWPAAMEAERASQMWSMRRKASDVASRSASGRATRGSTAAARA